MHSLVLLDALADVSQTARLSDLATRLFEQIKLFYVKYGLLLLRKFPVMQKQMSYS